MGLFFSSGADLLLVSLPLVLKILLNLEQVRNYLGEQPLREVQILALLTHFVSVVREYYYYFLLFIPV